MPDELNLRDARPDDVPVLLRLIRALAEYEHLAHELRATEASLHTALFGDPARAHALIAELRGEPIGYAMWYYTFNSFAACAGLFVEDVFLIDAYRGRGFGRTIFRDLARRAVAQGCGQMNWVVLDWNAPAKSFYRGLGATAQQGWTIQLLKGDALAALAA